MPEKMILGLDLGSNSAGWALIGLNAAGKPCRLVDLGVRIFPEGVEAKTGVSKSEARRKARAARRVHQRRNQRRNVLKNALVQAGLLPSDTKAFNECMGLNPYALRAKALTQRLESNELGRALYHLAQRRGFKSNRKGDETEEKKKEKGDIQKGIGDLERRMEATRSKTLGDYFNKPDSEREKIRNHYTARYMYEVEFEQIFENQRKYDGTRLTDDLKDKVEHALFFQRPYDIRKRWGKNLERLPKAANAWRAPDVGECEYESGERRSPKGSWYAQQFRLLPEVNNLLVIDTSTGEERPLTESERLALIENLQKKPEMSFDQIRKIKALDFIDTQKFNYELNGRRKKLLGNQTEAKLRDILEKDYERITRERRDQIIDALLDIEDPEVLKKQAKEDWGCTPAQANALAGCSLPSGHLNVSEKAIRRMLPFLEQGEKYMGDEEKPGAVQKAGYKRRDEREIEPKDFLTAKDVPGLPNPVVLRALHETRKVVNALIRKHGKPWKIRVEMARDLKVSLAERANILKEQTKNRDRNEKAREAVRAILREHHGAGAEPNGEDIIKYKLWQECGRTCPYTGKPINDAALFGKAPQFEIEHIWPLSKCEDNSFLNKTLCHIGENRRKGDRTPWDAYQGTGQWGEIQLRLSKMDEMHPAKKRKFLAKEIPQDFSSRKLNDTRYISREVRAMLACLVDGTNNVQIGRGQVTAELRGIWGLNSILSGGPEKTREDHRHHAVDAVVISLTDPATVRDMSRWRALRIKGTSKERFPDPWETFRDDVKKRIESAIVSHRVQRKVSGALHQETNYGIPKDREGKQLTDAKGQPLYAVRKELSKLTKSEFGDIVDAVVKKTLLAHLKGNGVDFDSMSEKSAAWKKAVNPKETPSPRVPTKDGKEGPPIKKVRLHKPSTGMRLLPRNGNPQDIYRAVASGGNHHIVIYEYKDKKGKAKWDGKVVNLFDAAQRARKDGSIIQRELGDGEKFVMSLSKNEMIRLDGEMQGLWKVKDIDAGNVRVQIQPHTATQDHGATYKSPDVLRKLKAEKAVVGPTGRIFPAHD